MELFKTEHQYWPGQLARGLFTGLLTGLVISLYSQAVFLAGELNKSYPFLVLFIPAAAVLTQYLFKLSGERFRSSTVSAIDEINNHRNKDHRNWAESQIPDSITPRMGLVAFLGAMLTHISGASGGKEGAGVQIGLSCASVIERAEVRINMLKQKEHDNRSDYYLMCGAAAAFSSLFNAPVAGVLFGTQLASPKATRLDAYLPCIAASYSSMLVSQATGCHVLEIPSYLPLSFDARTFIGVVVFAVLTGLYARLFCFVIHKLRDFFRKHIKNAYIVVLIPSLLLLAASLITYFILGTFRYNGLGGDLLYELIIGDANHIDDVIKLLMVSLTFASGFVGGEVVPLMIVGAGFGMSVASLLNLPGAAFAVLGSVGMLSGGTNLPLVCVALGMELYKYSEPSLLFIMCTLSFIASGKGGIYAHQKLPYR